MFFKKRFLQPLTISAIAFSLVMGSFSPLSTGQLLSANSAQSSNLLLSAFSPLLVQADELDELIYDDIADVDEDTYMGMTMEQEGPIETWKGSDSGAADEEEEETFQYVFTGTARPRASVFPTHGIDVSKWQNYANYNTNKSYDIDWKAVKADGYEFVIIKVGGRYSTLTGENSGKLYEDPFYKQNIEGAQKAGLKVGVYFFSAAINASEARQEALYTLKLIKNYDLQLPVFFDYEWSSGYRLALPSTVAVRTEVCRTFMSIITDYGYTAGLYSSDSMLNGDEGGSYYDDAGQQTGVNGIELAKTYRIWCARYKYSDGVYHAPGLYYDGVYDLWQYGSKGAVDGIVGNVDMNVWFNDGKYCGGSYFNASEKIECKPMYRLYNPDTREHLYTADKYERYVLTTKQNWDDEGIAWYAPVESKTPVYRLFNVYSKEHFYTTDKNERNTLLANGSWNDEGIGWYSDDGKGVPVYRVFHPTLPSIGSHHYTADKNEYVTLKSKAGGWNDEGIAWYGVNDARRK